MPHKSCVAAPFALAFASLLQAGAARASGALELTGAPTSANGLNARALARGPEAAFFNPALLPYAAATTQAGFFVLVTHGDITLAPRPPGVDVPESVYDGQIRNPDGSTSRLTHRPMPGSKLATPRADTRDREIVPYATLGLVRPLYQDRLVLGFYALLPLRSFQEQQAFFPDERAQYFSNRLEFEMLGDRLSVTSLAVSMAGRITRWLSVGAGVDVTIGTSARTAVHVPDASDQRTALINPDVEVESVFAPYFAFATSPTPWLRLSATLHLASASDTDGENRIRFWNYPYPEGESSVSQAYRLTLDHQPTRVGVGASVMGPPSEDRAGGTAARSKSLALPAWEIGAQALLTRWSEYRDRHAESPPDPWSSTLSVGLGGAVALGGRRFSADVAFTPSPVPDQTGRTNYVDNPRLALSASFETPVSLFGADFGVGVFLHGQLLVAREVSKSPSARNPVFDEVPDNLVDIVSGEPIDGAGGLQTNNPGYPGFSSGGWLAGAGFVLQLPE
jgi:long-chain fatty acid transport protein